MVSQLILVELFYVGEGLSFEGVVFIAGLRFEHQDFLLHLGSMAAAGDSARLEEFLLESHRSRGHFLR